VLQYRRRDSQQTLVSQPQNDITLNPLLTYCNWSYAKEYHIQLETLQDILKNFNENYIPFYLRIFNETPKNILESFLNQHHISKATTQTIYETLIGRNFQLKAFS